MERILADGEAPFLAGGKALTLRRHFIEDVRTADLHEQIRTLQKARSPAVRDFALSWLDPSLRIAGGTDEVLVNTLAERILGLPQDYRPDKGVPFNQS